MAESYSPPSFDENQLKPSAETREATSQYGLSHTMFRIKDPKISIPFYVDTLGFTVVHTSPSEKGRFTNYFLVYAPQGAVPTDAAAKSTWLWNQQGVLELCHNWGTENDAAFKHCSGNEPEHKGFGHICLLVDDLEKACARMEAKGVSFKKKPSEGSMRHIAFILDPDNYWIELIARGGGKRE